MSSTAGNEASEVFPATLDALYGMLSFIEGGARLSSQDMPFLLRVRLACEEALVNIIKHGKAEHGIGLRFQAHRKWLLVELCDQGVPFNPLDLAKVGSHEGTREDKGWGIRLMMRSADEVRYSREGENNRLILVFDAG